MGMLEGSLTFALTNMSQFFQILSVFVACESNMKTLAAHFNNTVIILITGIILVTLIVMLNFHSVTSLIGTELQTYL